MKTFLKDFQRFFFRGLATLLPTVLTIWLLVMAFQFVRDNIAEPINAVIRQETVRWTDWPTVDAEQIEKRERWLEQNRPDLIDRWRPDPDAPPTAEAAYERRLRVEARRAKLEAMWKRNALVFDLIGMVTAVVGIYFAGFFVAGFIGGQIVRKTEDFIVQLPLVKRLYPSLKQVTDFLFGENLKSKMQFSRVVAVQYPRKGIWSIGLVTGETMSTIQGQAQQECMTVFIPSSPTPFTGYVITVPRVDTTDLPITIEDALKFTVSGGVLLPPTEAPAHHDEAAPLPEGASASESPAPAGAPGGEAPEATESGALERTSSDPR